jgi:hypothetical protein
MILYRLSELLLRISQGLFNLSHFLYCDSRSIIINHNECFKCEDAEWI